MSIKHPSLSIIMDKAHPEDAAALEWFEGLSASEKTTTILIGRAGIERMHCLHRRSDDAEAHRRLRAELLETHREQCRGEWQRELDDAVGSREARIQDWKRTAEEREAEAELERRRCRDREQELDKLREEVAEKQRFLSEHSENVARIASEKAAAAAAEQVLGLERLRAETQARLEAAEQSTEGMRVELSEAREEAGRLRDRIHDDELHRAHSQGKGIEDENDWEEYLRECPLLAEYERVSSTDRSGDHILKTHRGVRIMWENKNYGPGPKNTVPAREIVKLKLDMNATHIAVGVLVAKHSVTGGGQRSERFALNDGTPATIHICPDIDVHDESSRTVALSLIHVANLEAAERGEDAEGQALSQVAEEAFRAVKHCREEQQRGVARAKEELERQEKTLRAYTELEEKLAAAAARHRLFVGSSLCPEAERELAQEYVHTGDPSCCFVVVADLMARHHLKERDMQDRFGEAYVHTLLHKTRDKKLMAFVEEQRRLKLLPPRGKVVNVLRGYRERKRKAVHVAECE